MQHFVLRTATLIRLCY